MEKLRVGLLVGREKSLVSALLQEITSNYSHVDVGIARLGAVELGEDCRYSVIVDRLSHVVPFYKAYLKHALVSGVYVINNPFVSSSDDKFHQVSLAHKLGLLTPKTVLLPNHYFLENYSPSRELVSHPLPVDWYEVAEEVGLPCILKDAEKGEWSELHICHSVDELMENYRHTSTRTVMVQELIDWDLFVRCLVIGEEVIPMYFDFQKKRYLPGSQGIPNELEESIMSDSSKIVKELGYDINLVEWAVYEDKAFLIDCFNPIPDIDPDAMEESDFKWAIKALAELLNQLTIKIANGEAIYRNPKLGS
ncbi:glutathione synthase/ribosomal protein S6 modification glutaminyl transferase-like protein [Thermobaculum terrenum ATCC BAA-798]|uniref:Glutathione synthase/ribosomal protein S6 modification glutaminyl transferase-like protein n=1 Tax=Thermobaculum terrenum (strain ATCC BAA-798 / CCMEE 7001 / YNP1) TaxID=525904 RepID=D1CE73_THET1|nr:hypothetical protein [Thermobaculum terrenum]ACZ41229.1 glutathione synthase/ribosomal protein S6 modification glutaminyl transferase-like protein [Thermobaculum terrenum ATCC BAA-798]